MTTRQAPSVALVVGRGSSQEETKLGEALGLGYLEAALKGSRSELDVVVVNAILDEELRGARTEDFQDAVLAAHRVAATNPIVCGVSLVYRSQRDWTQVFADALKERVPHCHVVVGGMFPTSAWELLLDTMPSVDSVCIGEGDLVLVELVDSIRSGGDFRAIAALAFRGADGRPVAGGLTSTELGLRRAPNAARLTAQQLGELAYPSRSQLPDVLRHHGVIQVEASRGCNAGCLFCEARNTNWRPRPVEHLVGELRTLAQAYPGTLIYLVDNIFLGFSQDGSHLERGREIARRIIAEGIEIRFVIQDRAANVDMETFQLLKQAGLCEVYLGVESFADSALRAFRKGADATASSNVEALQTLGKLELYTQFGYLPFHEKVTFDELVTTFEGLREVCENNPYLHVSNFNELIPYEGTYLARRYRKEHGHSPPLVNPWSYPDQRVRFIRNWTWWFSIALWPVTGLVFNAIQRPDYQRDLWRTLPVKNAAFVSFLEEILRLARDGQPDHSRTAAYFRESVAAAKQSIAQSLDSWAPGAALAEMRDAVQLIDADQALEQAHG